MEDGKYMAQRPSRWQFLAGSTFLLCLLLVGTVSTLIYVQLSSGACVSRAQRYGSADIQETIHLVGTDKMPLGDESISYNKEEGVAVYVGTDGAFNLQDFGKGLHITNIRGTAKCVVMVTDSSSITSSAMENFLQRRDGQKVTTTIGFDSNYRTLPGKIEDTSFISSRAEEHCTEGYQWVVPKVGEAVINGEEEHEIVKRSNGQAEILAAQFCDFHCHGFFDCHFECH